METLLIILSFILLFVLSLYYVNNQHKNQYLSREKKIEDLKRSNSNCIEKLIKKTEYSIGLNNTIEILKEEIARLENKIDLDAMSFDDIINKENNDTLISNFILELHFNLFNIDKYIETIKDKRSKEYKEVLKQKKLLMTYIESITNQFNEDKFDVELLNNYKSLSYKDLIVFDEDIDYKFALVDTGDIDELVCIIQSNADYIFSVPDEIDFVSKPNTITKEQENFLKENNLTHDAFVADKSDLI